MEPGNLVLVILGATLMALVVWSVKTRGEQIAREWEAAGLEAQAREVVPQNEAVPGTKWVLPELWSMVPPALWLVSLVLPVTDGFRGWAFALISIFPLTWLVVWPLFLGALPNILLLVGTVLMVRRKYRNAAVVGGIASGLSWVAGLVTSSLWAELGAGYWTWLASFLALLLLGVVSNIMAGVISAIRATRVKLAGLADKLLRLPYLLGRGLVLTLYSPRSEGNQMKMRGNGESGTLSGQDSRQSAAGSLSETEMKRALRSDALQHPTTILSLALSILSTVYLMLFSPVIGGDREAIVLIIVTGVAAAATFLWRYSIRFDVEYSERLQELVNLSERDRGEREQGELRRLLDTLQSGFNSLNTDEGPKTLKQLNYVYERLQLALETKRDTDPMSIAHIPALAKETYRQGLSALADAVELMAAIHSPASDRLKNEIVEIEKELDTLRGDESQAERWKMREETAASHKERLDLVGQQQLRVEQLLHQSERCEASLHRTWIQITALKADSAESSVRTVTETLRKTVNQAEEVQEEWRRLGY